MTTNITTIQTADGTAKIDSKLFIGYNQEALEILEKISELQKDFKEVVETVAENTGLKKPKVSKYFKERFKDSTKQTTQVGELFAKLDEVLN